jgi:hypothetical protein
MLMPSVKPLDELENASEFIARHIGISEADEAHMLSVIGEASRRALIDSIVPRSIARTAGMQLPPAVTEAAALAQLKALASKNQVFKSFIGQGYHGTHTPGVILRNILENPAWYTAYTPYQAEISQGRMEALVNFQTMVTDLTGMAIANASMLDEATAAAEAMTLAKRTVKSKSKVMRGFARLPPADDRSDPDPRRAAGHRRGGAAEHRPVERRAGGRALRRAGPVPLQHRPGGSTTSAVTRRKATRSRPPSSWPPTCWPSRCSGHRRARWVPTSWSAPRSASACPWAPAARTRPTWPAATSSSAALPGRLVGVSVDATATGLPPGAADARAAHPPRKGHLQHLHRAGAAGGRSPACTPSTTAPKGSSALRSAWPATPPCWPRAAKHGVPTAQRHRLRHPVVLTKDAEPR